jgi:hypothetical protein
MTKHFGSVSAEEHIYGNTQWIAIRARGAEWSWLLQMTPWFWLAIGW